MKKLTVFFVFMMIFCGAYAASPVQVATMGGYATNVFNTIVQKISKLPYCSDFITESCLLMPGSEMTVLQEITATGLKATRFEEKKYTNTDTKNTFSNSTETITLCESGTYLASCGSGDDKVTFDMDFVNDYLDLSGNETDSEKMKILRNVWAEQNLKKVIAEKCISVNGTNKNIVCKPCPTPGKIEQESTCTAQTGIAVAYNFTPVTAKILQTSQQTTTPEDSSDSNQNEDSSDSNQNIEGIKTLQGVKMVGQMNVTVKKCNIGKTANINTFWNCNIDTVSDKTGTFEYRKKTSNVKEDCYPAITNLPD